MNSTRCFLLPGGAENLLSDQRRDKEGAEGVGAAAVLSGERTEKGQGRAGEEGEFFRPARRSDVF